MPLRLWRDVEQHAKVNPDKGHQQGGYRGSFCMAWAGSSCDFRVETMGRT